VRRPEAAASQQAADQARGEALEQAAERAVRAWVARARARAVEEQGAQGWGAPVQAAPAV